VLAVPFESASADARLICDSDDRHSSPASFANQIDDSIKNLDLVRVAQVVPFRDDHAIAIQETGRGTDRCALEACPVNNTEKTGGLA
jgi:hypothetical protein